jgi:hypothetical protein
MAKKELLAVLKNVILLLSLGKAVNSIYSKLYINQSFKNLCYLMSLTKSYYCINNFFLFQKLFLTLNNVFLYLSAGTLDQNSFYSYTYIKTDIFFEKYLLFDAKFLQQKTFFTVKFNWQLASDNLFFERNLLTKSSLFFFDILNLSSLSFFGSYMDKKQINQDFLKLLK